jgi:glycosyltransferase involved in cell wall biosynthesis
MKIAIYDKWLSTLGGGEKVATVMAEVLSKHGYDVDLVSNFEVDKKELQEKMGVDLANVKMVAWYERSYFKLLPKTRKYDLLINVSFMDHMPSKAKRSIYYVHFPTPMKTTFLGFIKYEKILPFLRRFLIIPEIQSGINPVDDVYTRSGRWLSERNTIVFSNIPKDFLLTLRIYIEQLSLRSLKSISFGSPNANIKVLDSYIDHYFNVGVFKLKVNASGQDALVKIFISEDTKSNGFGLVSMAVRNIRFILWNFLKRYLPRYEMALYGSSSYRPGEGLDTYELFLANSEFTKYWTKKYLNKEAKILYPPVDIDKFKSGRKKNIILNVGRFFVGGHSKKQDVLLAVFKKMVDKKIIDESWELHFVGGLAGGKEHSDYLNKIREDAKGYKVYFHLFLPFEGLKKLYSAAKIYWHATGFGEDTRANPIAFEHFGITVVEAMAAGVVPIVFNGGGLTETVSKESGIVWNSCGELIKVTSKLISDAGLLKKLSKGAIERSKLFSKSRFEKELLKYVEE